MQKKIPLGTNNDSSEHRLIKLGDVVNSIAKDWLLETKQNARLESDQAGTQGEIEKREFVVQVVNDAVVAIVTEQNGKKKVSEIYNLSADKIRSVQKTVKQLRLTKKSIKVSDQYLYVLLLELSNKGLLNFQLPIEKANNPSRPTVFKADDPSLPSQSEFLGWQQRIASWALDIKQAVNLFGLGSFADQELEMKAISALLVFGCHTGRSALDLLSKLRKEDYHRTKNYLQMPNHSGIGFLYLILHPVQALAINFYLESINGKTLHKESDRLFPLLSTPAGRKKLSRRLENLLSETEAVETKIEGGKRKNKHKVAAEESNNMEAANSQKRLLKPNLQRLLAGTHRWLLNIYPPYLVSLLGGFYDAPDKPRTTIEDKLKVRHSTGSRSPRELEIRAALRHQLNKTFSQKNENKINGSIFPLYEVWGKVLIEFGFPSIYSLRLKAPIKSSTVITQEKDWNLYFFIRGLLKRIQTAKISRFNTVSRWFETGCLLVSALEDKGFWKLEGESIEELGDNFSENDIYYIKKHLEAMSREAAETGFCALEEMEALLTLLPKLLPGRESLKKQGLPPSDKEIAVVRKYLIGLSEEKRKLADLPAAAVLLYLDLLVLGLRKGEAIELKLEDFDLLYATDGSLISADCFIAGGKTPAARRVVSLLDSGFPESAANVILQIKKLLAYKKNIPSIAKEKFLTLIAGKKMESRPGASGKLIKVVDTIDKALKEAYERCGFDPVSPHPHRHASIASLLKEEKMSTERIAKTHGHVDLETTFTHYVHDLSEIQKKSLENFFSTSYKGEVWVAISDAVKLLGVSKQYLYGKYPQGGRELKTLRDTHVKEEGLPENAFFIRRKGNPLYIRGSCLVGDFTRRAGKKL